MKDEIETLSLFIIIDPQANELIDQLQQNPATYQSKQEGDGNTEDLDVKLSAHGRHAI